MLLANTARQRTKRAATVEGILLIIAEDISFESLQGNSQSSISIKNLSHLSIGIVTHTLLANGYRVWLTDNKEHIEINTRRGRRIPEFKLVVHYAW